MAYVTDPYSGNSVFVEDSFLSGFPSTQQYITIPGAGANERDIEVINPNYSIDRTAPNLQTFIDYYSANPQSSNFSPTKYSATGTTASGVPLSFVGEWADESTIPNVQNQYFQNAAQSYGFNPNTFNTGVYKSADWWNSPDAYNLYKMSQGIGNKVAADQAAADSDGGLFGLGDLGTALALGAGLYFGMPYLSEAFAGGAGALGAGEAAGAGLGAVDYSLAAGGIPSLSGYGAAGLAGTGTPMLSTYGMGGLSGALGTTGGTALGSLAGLGGLTGSAMTSGGWLGSLANQLGESAIKQGVQSTLGTSGQQPTGTGGNMATTDWSGMLGNLLGGAGTYLGTNAVLGNYEDAASQLAAGVKFKPYAITSDIGRTYQDPVTGEMVSSLAAPFAAQQQGMLGQVGANLAAAQADPMLAAQDAYSKMRQLSSFEEQQKQQELENRLLQQGMLGSTGGATRSRALQDAIMQNQVNQQLQSIGLGQQLTNNAVDRAGKLWTGAMAPTAAMASQMGQSGAFGNYAQGGQLKAADIMNQANLGKLGLQTKTIGGLFGSPTFSSTGQQTSTGGIGTQIGNWLGNNVGDWLSGSSNVPTWTTYDPWAVSTPTYDFSMPGTLDYSTGENLLGMLGW